MSENEYTFIFMAFNSANKLVAAKKVLCADDKKYIEAYDQFEEETITTGSAETIGVMNGENLQDIQNLDTDEFYDNGI